MLNSTNSSSLVIIQKFILLATEMQNSVALRNKVVALHEQANDLDRLAELADAFMTKLNENSDYNNSQTAAAAQEWLANIRATNESLAIDAEAIQGLIDNFNDGNVQSEAVAENKDGGDSSAAAPSASPSSTTPASNDGNILII
ncbi:MAG: hypothetical protein OEX82_04710 [Nitrosomonas sp.]|nr:hypothetical protein [Nitrosomonas sp.]